LHTSFSRDWSSDVCSSDLLGVHRVQMFLEGHQSRRSSPGRRISGISYKIECFTDFLIGGETKILCFFTFGIFWKIGCTSRKKDRSEERPVGKECRCRREED